MFDHGADHAVNCVACHEWYSVPENAAQPCGFLEPVHDSTAEALARVNEVISKKSKDFTTAIERARPVGEEND